MVRPPAEPKAWRLAERGVEVLAGSLGDRSAHGYDPDHVPSGEQHAKTHAVLRRELTVPANLQPSAAADKSVDDHQQP